jgi:hypothetical protein
LPLRNYAIPYMPLRHYAIAPLRHFLFAITPLRHYAVAPLRHCTILKVFPNN